MSQNEAKYLYIGGYAYVIYARLRYTKDVDIFYSRNSKNAEKLINILKQFGFVALEIKEDDFLNEGQVIQLGIPPYRIDLLNKIEGVSFEEAWKNREISRYGDQEISVISKKDLIKNKQATGRKQDQLDVENLKNAD